MSGFSPDWLALREPVDHRSRDARLAEALRRHFAGRSNVSVVDLGCGAGSNIRATYALLPELQHWTLVDYDDRLLGVARTRLAAWGDACAAEGDTLLLRKSGKSMRVAFRQSDLNADLGGALGSEPDLVTASALFDLCSEAFIRRFANEVAVRSAAFYTVLTYNGDQMWTPAHPADAEMAAAFHGHQLTDKGFGRSAGPNAPEVLKAAFMAAGMTVVEGSSPWVLGMVDRQLISDLANGFADAVAETVAMPPELIGTWRRLTRTGAVVGHTDTLALPGSAA